MAKGERTSGPHGLKSRNRRMRTRMSGGVGGVEPRGSPLSRYGGAKSRSPAAFEDDIGTSWGEASPCPMVGKLQDSSGRQVHHRGAPLDAVVEVFLNL